MATTLKSSPQKFGTILSVLLAPFAKRFIAGTTLAEALNVTAGLKSQGFYTTLDHLGECVESEFEAKASADQYIVMLKGLRERKLDLNVSLKLTQMGLGLNNALCLDNVKRIVQFAESMGGFVRIDMEGSDVTQKTIDILKNVKATRATPVGIVLQAMLKRTPQDLLDLTNLGVTIRLCKGAYKESPELAHQDMRDIRHQFATLAKRLITSGSYHAIATHDELLVREITTFVKQQKISAEKFEFQMLYGIRPSLQKKLVSEGFRVRLYVPFGRSWLPYTWRRIRERKENLWFVVSHFFRR